MTLTKREVTDRISYFVMLINRINQISRTDKPELSGKKKELKKTLAIITEKYGIKQIDDNLYRMDNLYFSLHTMRYADKKKSSLLTYTIGKI